VSEQIIAAELHRNSNGTVDRIVFNGETYVRRNTVPPPDPLVAGWVGDNDPEGTIPEAFMDINRQRSYVGVLHDRPEPMEPPPADSSWVKMAPWNHPSATQGGDVEDWVRTRWLRRWKRIR
jgi:hypothetical protein